MGAVARRYAKALFQVAKEREQLGGIQVELAALAQALNENPAFLQFLRHPSIEKRKKKEMVNRLFRDQLSQPTTNLLQLLIDRDREDELEQIVAAYNRMVDQEQGVVEAVVSTASPLPREKEEELRDVLGRLTGQEVRLQAEVDASLLGGIKVQVGDRIFDGSVRGKLSRFQRILERTKS